MDAYARLSGVQSDMFATYSAEFEDYRTQLGHAMDDYVIADASKRPALAKKIKADLDEVAELLKQMELEVRSHQGPARETLNSKLVGESERIQPRWAAFLCLVPPSASALADSSSAGHRKGKQELQKAWRTAKEQAETGDRSSLMSHRDGTDVRDAPLHAALSGGDRCPFFPCP